jgi:HK97 family phage portal protein
VRSLRTLVNKSPVPLSAVSSRLGGMLGGTPNNAVGQMQAYGSVGTLFGIVNRTSNGTAKVNWRLWRNPRTPTGERVEVTAHAALDLWHKPNPFMARQEFVEAEQQHIDLTGEGWWVIGRDARSSLPLELWPIRPDRMAPVPHPTEFLAGYVYRSWDGQLIPLGLDEVIQLKMPNPLDPYRGMGPVQAIMSVLDSRRYSIEWNRNFFINSAEPGGFVKFEKSLSDTEFARWQERWREQHKGVAAAHQVGILENAEWVERKFTQRDMQFAQLTDVTGDLMREAFGIHKASLGLADDVNRANAEAARWLFAEEIVKPRLDRFKGALNEKLLPLFGGPGGAVDPLLEWDYDDPTPSSAEQENADRDSAVTAAMAIIAQGGDWDETLAAFGLPAIPRAEMPALTTAPPALAPGAP